MQKFLIATFLSFLFLGEIFSEESKEDGQKIRSIFFTSRRERIEYISVSDGIVVEDVEIPNIEKLKKEMRHFLGKPITFKRIQKIKDETIEHFYKYGSYLVSVKILEGSDISNGVIPIHIFIGKLGDIKVKGAKYFKESGIKDLIRIKRGQYIDRDKLRDDLIWLNKNPFKSASIAYEPGKEFQTTDLEIFVKDRFPLQVYGMYENSGSGIAGRDRFIAGTTYGNLFGKDQEINVQFMSAPDMDKWWGVSGYYICPFPWRDRLRVLWSYVKTRPNKDEDMKLTGKGWNILPRYEVFFSGFRRYSHRAVLGYDFKRTNNFLTFQKTLVYDKYIDVSQFLIRYIATLRDKLGHTSFDIAMYISPGKMTHYNKTRYFKQERERARAYYLYWTLNAERLTELGWGWRLFSKAMFQISTERLIPSEALALGGYNTVRGYKENEVIGDKGMALINEVRSRTFISRKGDKKLQFLAFLDFGILSDADKNVISKNSQTLLSVGPGIRFTFRENLSIRFDYGLQLKSVKDKLFGKNRHSRAHAGVILSF